MLVIGLAHATLLRNGDIRVPYAVMEFVLLLVRNAPNNKLVLVAILGLFFRYADRELWALAGLSFPSRPDPFDMGLLAISG